MANVMRFINKFPELLLRSPLHRFLSNDIMLITFTGRKSGKQFTTPINYFRQDDTVLTTTDSPWWKNLRGGAPVTLRIKGQTLTGIAEAITDEEGITQGLEELLIRFPGYYKYVDVHLQPDGKVNRTEAAAAIKKGRVLVRIKLNQKARA